MIAAWEKAVGARHNIWANRYVPTDTSPPTANAGPDQTVTAGNLVTFDGSGSTDNVGVVNYTWTFTDGGAKARYGVSPTYTFASAGVFVVTLTVRDAAGNTATDSMVVTVSARPGGGGTPAEAVPPLVLVAIGLLAVLAAAFVVIYLLARRKRRAGPSAAKRPPEQEGPGR